MVPSRTRCSVLSPLPARSTSSTVAAGSAIRSPLPASPAAGSDPVVVVAQARSEGGGGGEQLGGTPATSAWIGSASMSAFIAGSRLEVLNGCWDRSHGGVPRTDRRV